MNRHLLLFLFCLCASIGLFAQQEGNNLILNGDFSELIDGRPNFWSSSPEPFSYFRTQGGPNGLNYLSMCEADNEGYENKVRVNSLTLVPGESYRLSAMVRTTNFTASRGDILVIDNGWYRETGFQNFPKNTDGWQKYEKVIKAPESSDTTKYDLVILTINQKGAMDVTDVKLIPLTEKAIEESKPTTSRSMADHARLFPWFPSFNEVPISNPAISFMWYGTLSKDFKPQDFLAQAVGEGFTSPLVPFETGKPFRFTLKGMKAGLQNLTVKIIAKADAKVAYEETFIVNLRDIPTEAQATKGTRLNNFTVELVNRRVNPNQTIEFTTAHDQWMYFTVKTPTNKDFTMLLDGAKIDDPATGLPEAFRLVPAGRHTIAADCRGTLIVRAIAELFSCAICEGPRVTNFPTFNWEFAKKWMLPAVTSPNRGGPNEQMLKECHDSGRIWTGNLWAVNPPTVEEQLRRIDSALKGLKGRDGVTADELFYTTPEIDNYTQALKMHPYNRDILIYTWGCGEPGMRGMHTDFIATCLNASHGRGKILREAYIGANQLSEEKAKKVAYANMGNYFKISKSFYPDFARRAGIILGNFNQLNVITLEYYPQVDFKYYLDMQMNILANDPLFEGLGMTGYWGTHYADEEMYRWSHALLRHYVVEGQKEMLSKKYGFSYVPGHIENNDFADGLKGWTVIEGEKGSVGTAYNKELNHRNQNRWGGAGDIGNTFCTLKVVAGKPNTVSQVAKNLIPGKQYMLLFTAGSYDDLKIQKFNPREFGFDATISDAEIVPEDSFVFVDKREKGNYAFNHNIARQNLYRYVFKPKKSEVTITFSDAKAIPGETLMFNYVQVKPFFPKVEY